MRVCLKHGLWIAALGAAGLNGAPALEEARQYRSVVRTDAKGHLVRTMVISPRVVTPKIVEPAVAVVASPTAEPIPVNAEVGEIIEKTAAKYDVDPLLVHSVISVESAYNAKAVSNKGAQGLMQLIPATARRFGALNAFDVRQNVEAGVKYLKYLSTLFPDDLRLTLAAYNAGEGAVWKYGNNVPPYRETEQYVYKVGQRYGKARKNAAPKKTPAEVKVAANEPSYRPIQSYVDAEGRLHMRTTP